MEQHHGKRDLDEALIKHVRTTGIRKLAEQSTPQLSFAREKEQRDAETNQQANQQFHDKRSINGWAGGSATLWQRVRQGV
jgi:hypothetical protein